MKLPLLPALTLACLFCIGTTISAGDWPQILGPNRNGITTREKLAHSWPEKGPEEVWKKEVGQGLAGVAVAQGKLLLYHRPQFDDVIEALDPQTGKPLWSKSFPSRYQGSFVNDEGPRCVPVIHKEVVILYSAQGVLRCLKLADGALIWEVETHKKYDAPEGYFGAASSPIVVDDLVIVNVGGDAENSGVVAFSLKDGSEVWKATNDKASYSSPILATIDGTQHLLVVTRLNFFSLDPATGKVRFTFPFGKRGPTVNAANPVMVDEDHFFLTASYGVGAVCAQVKDNQAKILYQVNELLSSQYTTPIVDNGLVYGIHGRQDVGEAVLVCLNPLTQKVHWQEEGIGYATLLLADGKLLIMKTDGTLILAKLDSTKYTELDRRQLLSGTTRALPALANGLFYVRDDNTLKCFDLR